MAEWKKNGKNAFFFLMQKLENVELYILLSGDSKPTLLRILTLILLV